MKQSLSQKQQQTLTMTPSLQQAIKLLQLSSQEIMLEIREQLESNIMLESEEFLDVDSGATDEHTDVEHELDLKNENPDSESGEIGDNPVSADSSSEVREGSITAEIRKDSQGNDCDDDYLERLNGMVPDSAHQARSSSNVDVIERSEENLHLRGSLKDHLIEQLNLLTLKDTIKASALLVIDYIDDDGLLALPEEYKNNENIKVAVNLIQGFDPAGVGAQDLRESLKLQLIAGDADTIIKRHALEIIEKYFNLMLSKEMTLLMKKLNINESTLKQVLILIRSLSPRPGAPFYNEKSNYIRPDVYVRKINEIWRVEVNSDLMPSLKINNYYQNLIPKSENKDSGILKEHLKDANWFIKSLKERNNTVLEVAKAIVARQKDFFDKGDQAMKPMNLQDIAVEVGRHESTVSRATQSKYMDTPRGIYELKYFFDSHVYTKDGSEASSIVIRSHIKKIVSDEDSCSPYSDQKLSEMLSKLGFKVARRTVAKYRGALSIPSSSDRRELLKKEA